ncbi:MAG TPA: hypothetical protein VFC00_18465 [Micromonosporaceae bacterium]|nr:hypothetical protein [Micromonosporaceae bacterium]
MVSTRVHSRYQRQLSDTALGGRPVEVRLRVRRFVCAQQSCATRRFAEQVPMLTSRYGRRSLLLARTLEALGPAMAGRAAARLVCRLGVLVSRSTLLRLVRRLPDPQPASLRVVGVDDFALRRARLRHCPGRPGHPPAGRRAARPGGRHARRLAARPPWR